MKNCFAVCILFCICSCSVIDRRIFSTTQVNNPSLQKKNDHSFSVTYSLPSGFDLTGGYAITNRLAIIGGAYSYKNRDEEKTAVLLSNDNSTASLLYRHKGYHGGLGVFLPLSEKPSSFISFFGGYTYGSFRMDERFYENSSTSPAPPTTPTRISFYKGNIGRHFLQGSLNFYGKEVEASFISRYNYVNYSNVVTDYTIDEQHSFSLPPTGNPKHSQFLDLAFDTKFYFSQDRKIGLQVFGSATTRLTNREENFRYYGLRAGVGIFFKNFLHK